MISEARVRSLLREYFLGKECEEYPYLDKFFDLAFKDGRNLVAIKLIAIYASNPAEITREAENAMLEALRLGSGKVDKIYLAVPAKTNMAALPSPEQFRRSGVGLLVVGKNVEERVPAKPLRDETLDLKQLENLQTTLNALKARIYTIEERMRGLEALRQRLSSLENKVIDLEKTLSRIRRESPGLVSTTQQVLSAKEYVIGEEAGDLPEFAKNNPWLAVLSKRGSEEES